MQNRDFRTGCRTASVRIEQKSLSESGQFEGYGSVFGVKDSYGEIVAPGAFKRSLGEHRAAGTLPALLWQHNPYEPIGYYTEMFEDEKGLFVRGQLLQEVTRGREAYALLKGGGLDGLSIGFVPVADQKDHDTGTKTLTDVDLWEVSLVTFPANFSSRVSGHKAVDEISSLQDWKSVEAFLRDEGNLSKKAAAAFVAAAKRIRDGERDAREARASLGESTARLLSILEN